MTTSFDVYVFHLALMGLGLGEWQRENDSVFSSPTKVHGCMKKVFAYGNCGASGRVVFFP